MATETLSAAADDDIVSAISYEMEQLAKDLMQEMPRGGTSRNEEEYQIRLRQRIRGARLLQLSSALLCLDEGDTASAAVKVFGDSTEAAA